MKTQLKSETKTVAGKHKRLRRALATGHDLTDVAALTQAVDDALARASGTRESVGHAALALLALALQSAGVSLESDGSDTALVAKLNRLCALPLRPEYVRRTVRLLSRIEVAGASVGPRLDFQFGYDGHALTREQAARLGLVRYFEKSSSPFAALLGKAFGYLARSGPAYLAWTRRVPLLVCDLNCAAHRDCARLMREYANDELVVVSPACPPEATRHWSGESARLLVQDDLGLMKGLIGIDAQALLIERRLAGWTVTFATGRAHPKDLADARLPAAFRALARTALNAPRRAGETLDEEGEGACAG